MKATELNKLAKHNIFRILEQAAVNGKFQLIFPDKSLPDDTYELLLGLGYKLRKAQYHRDDTVVSWKDEDIK